MSLLDPIFHEFANSETVMMNFDRTAGIKEAPNTTEKPHPFLLFRQLVWTELQPFARITPPKIHTRMTVVFIRRTDSAKEPDALAHCRLHDVPVHPSRPFEIWPMLGDLRIELIYMIVMCGYWLAAARKQWLPNPLQKAFIAFPFLAPTVRLLTFR